ncbi:MAG: hypothetical protein JXR48_05160 [Candidatus Delongbacteria bacterium]|nr:hypothetical protein [Candidatus Delongbacteria bacterium]MBN2834337.1 hypothetical protein [Candidatus Delongbacteria bacterium]
MEIDMVKAEKLLNKWQKILKLQDWDIKLEIVEKVWRKSADIKINDNLRLAILLLNANPVTKNLEELIIHELLHLKLWGMDQMIETLLIGTFGENSNDPKYDFAYGQFMNTLESTVADLTKSFLTEVGEDKNICFGSIDKMVKEEIGE